MQYPPRIDSIMWDLLINSDEPLNREEQTNVEMVVREELTEIRDRIYKLSGTKIQVRVVSYGWHLMPRGQS